MEATLESTAKTTLEATSESTAKTAQEKLPKTDTKDPGKRPFATPSPKTSGKKDLWIIGGVLVLALIGWVVMKVTQPTPAYVTVYVADQVYARVPIDEFQTITVDQEDGKINVVTIDETGVRMASSTCHNQLCVQQGTMNPQTMEELPLGNWIVCLPNRVSVELSGAEESVGVS